MNCPGGADFLGEVLLGLVLRCSPTNPGVNPGLSPGLFWYLLDNAGLLAGLIVPPLLNLILKKNIEIFLSQFFCIILMHIPATCSWITFTVWSMYTGAFLKSEKNQNYVRISFWSDICKLQDILILRKIIYSPSFCENYVLLFQSDTYAATTVFCAIILHLTQLVFVDVQKTYYVGKRCNRNQKSASFHQKISYR